MILVTIDNCAACEVIKARHPELDTRKPTLSELTNEEFKTFPTLITHKGSKLERLDQIEFYLRALKDS